MKHALRTMMVVGFSLVFGLAAHAAPASTYTLTCNGRTPLNLTLTSFTLEYSTPASAAMVNGRRNSYLGSFRVPAGRSYSDLQLIVMTNQVLPVCKLTETTGGSTLEWTLNDAVFSSVTVIGSDGSNAGSGGANVPTSLIQVTFACSTAGFATKP